MVLTHDNVKSRLSAIAADPTTPREIADYLNRLLNSHPKLGRSLVTVGATVDAYLETTPALLDKARLTAAIAWVIENWERLPES